MGVIQLEKMVQNLFLILYKIVPETTPTLKGIQISFNSQAKVAKDDRMVLDFLFAGQGVVFVIANTSYCTLMNALDQVEKSIQKFKENVIWLYKVDWWVWGFV